MKKFLAVVITFVLMAGLPALNVQAARPALVTINFWHFKPDNEFVGIQKLLKEFKEDHPNVTINSYHYSNLFGELGAAIDAGTAPDLVLAPNDNIGTLAYLNWVIDLNQLGIKANWLNNQYAPVAAKGVQDGGKIWALPFTQEGIALVYNKALVPAQYLPVDPLDFSALRAKAAAYLADTGRPLICNQGFPGYDAYHTAPVFFGFGVPAYIDAAGKAYANSPAALAAGAWLASLPPISPAAQDYSSCMSQLISGQVGMWWTGPWAMVDINASGLQTGILPMGRPFVGIESLLVTSAAQQSGRAGVALELAKFLTNTESSISLSKTNATVPANRAALKNPHVQGQPSVAGFSAALQLGVPMSPSILSQCQWGPMGNAQASIWGGMDVKTALDQAQSDIESCVSSLLTP